MAIFTVNNNNDSGLGSLRQAIADANAATGVDTIEFNNNLSGQTITLTSGELQITDDLTINGLGADLLTISGNNADRVFLVDDEDDSNGIDVTLAGLAIVEGNSDDGAGIRNLENLTVLNSTIASNTGSGIYNARYGGSYGVNSGSNLTVTDSNISDNTSRGISSAYGLITVANSNISNNLDAGMGGIDSSWVIDNSVISENGSGIGIGWASLTMTDSIISNNRGTGFSGDRVNFEIDNTIFSGNTTTGDGGGISGGSYSFSGTVSNSRITNNIADSDGDGNGNGGGVNKYVGGGGITFENTIIAGNFDNSPEGSEQHPDVSGAFLGSNGYNFVGDITGLRYANPFIMPGDLFGTSDNPLDLSQVIDGTPGDDSLAGTGGIERIEGGNGNDTLRGRGGVDVLLGEADHDSILGGNGADQLFGNADDDRLVGANGDDTLDGGTGADQLLGQGDNDLLMGGEDNDTLNGGTGADQLFGNTGDDRLVGGDGDDTLNGGTGQDVLIGGAGSDRFLLVSGLTGDRDIIRDYQDSLDRLVLTGDLSFAGLTISQTGVNTRIRETATNQTLAILNDIDASIITQHDFEFGAGINGIRVEAEDYVNYYDATPGNTGGAYRSDDVDLEVTSDLGGGYNVGYIDAGEWLIYNVNLAESGLYQVVARVASATEDGRIHNLDLSLDGQSSSLNFNATGGWQSWTNVIGDKLNLNAGSQELRLDMGSSGFNLNYVDLIRLVRVEAEDYKEYSDTTPGNLGGAYRNDDVDIEITTDIGGGFNVGWIDQGESLTYDVEIPQDGLYQIVARVASASNQTHRLSASIDGEFTNLNFDGTGGWQSWTDLSGGNLNLNAGSQELRLDLGSSGFNLNYVDLIPVTDLSNIVDDYYFVASATVIPEVVEVF